jgi:hypothetical protein
VKNRENCQWNQVLQLIARNLFREKQKNQLQRDFIRKSASKRTQRNVKDKFQETFIW